MSADLVTGPVRVRASATSANLGPGFDALGLALGLHDDVVGRVTDTGLDVRASGEGTAGLARDETHLVVRSMRRTFDELAASPPGLAIECRNRIPHGRGLGSSAAAIVSGVLLARALVDGGEQRMPDEDALALAADIEGHPDNVAPCLLGGLTVAWSHRGRARAVRRDIDERIVPIAFIPPFTASTQLTRGLLPATVPHVDAAFTAGRAALLVTALTGAGQAIFDATEDRLHQQYRAPAMPASAELVARLRAGGHAAVISGAGPTVLVLARHQVEAERTLALAPEGWDAKVLTVERAGAHLVNALD